MPQGDAAAVALTKLHELARELGKLRELDASLHAILRAAAGLHGAGTGRVSLRDPSTTALEVVATCGFLAESGPVHSTRIGGRMSTELGVLSIQSSEAPVPSLVEVQVAEICARFAADAVEAARAQEAMRESERRKQEFLATLAHELRNPLAPIRNGVHLLALAPAGSAAAEEARAMIERQTNHLARLLDDLLEVARISTGKLELRRRPVELAAVVGSAIETSRPLIEARGHALHTRLPGEAVKVDADPLRLAQAVSNLLNNAAKYTRDKGVIELSVRREARHAVVSVRDNGIGIEPAMLPRVFDLFAQVGCGEGEGGLGVGLTLARRVVLLHGGSIEARSAGPGKGSEFLLRLSAV